MHGPGARRVHHPLVSLPELVDQRAATRRVVRPFGFFGGTVHRLDQVGAVFQPRHLVRGMEHVAGEPFERVGLEAGAPLAVDVAFPDREIRHGRQVALPDRIHHRGIDAGAVEQGREFADDPGVHRGAHLRGVIDDALLLAEPGQVALDLRPVLTHPAPPLGLAFEPRERDDVPLGVLDGHEVAAEPREREIRRRQPAGLELLAQPGHAGAMPPEAARPVGLALGIQRLDALPLFRLEQRAIAPNPINGGAIGLVGLPVSGQVRLVDVGQYDGVELVLLGDIGVADAAIERVCGRRQGLPLADKSLLRLMAALGLGMIRIETGQRGVVHQGGQLLGTAAVCGGKAAPVLGERHHGLVAVAAIGVHVALRFQVGVDRRHAGARELAEVVQRHGRQQLRLDVGSPTFDCVGDVLARQVEGIPPIARRYRRGGSSISPENTFRAKSLASFALCRSCSSSEGVSVSEVADVSGFVGGEAGRIDLEEVSDCISKPPFDIAHDAARRRQYTRAASIDKHDDADHFAAAGLNMVREVGNCRPHDGDIVDQHIAAAALHRPAELCARRDPLHRAGTGMVGAVRLHDIGRIAVAGRLRVPGGQHRWDAIPSCDLLGNDRCIDDAAPESISGGGQILRPNEIAHQARSGRHIACLGIGIIDVGLQGFRVPEGRNRHRCGRGDTGAAPAVSNAERPPYNFALGLRPQRGHGECAQLRRRDAAELRAEARQRPRLHATDDVVDPTAQSARRRVVFFDSVGAEFLNRERARGTRSRDAGPGPVEEDPGAAS